MAKQQLNWSNLPVAEMPKDLLKLHANYVSAQENIAAWFNDNARKAGKLSAGECIKVSVRENGIGFAKASGAKVNATAKGMFDSI